MNAVLQLAHGVAAEGAFAAFVVFLRVGAAIAALPAFGETFLPVRVRLAITVAFTAVVAPAVAPDLGRIAPDDRLTMLFLLTETVSGLALGLVLRAMVMALQMAGAMVAQATSLSQILAGAAPEPQPAVGHLLLMGGLALAAMSGLHVRLAEALILSYDVFPAGRLPAAGDLRDWGVAALAHGFGLAFSLSAPFVIAGLVYNVALGVINRAMPQLMVSLVGAPALTFGGLVLLCVAVPSGLEIWRAALLAVLADPFGIAP